MDSVKRQTIWRRADLVVSSAGESSEPPEHRLPAGGPGGGWAGRAIDGVVHVDGLDESELSALEAAWSRCGPPGPDSLGSKRRRLLRGREPWPLFHERLVHSMTAAAIDAGRGRLLMFHAAALASEATGATIVLVAPSGTGKTTATRFLARYLGYVTDETAAALPDGRMLPFPKPLSALGPSGLRPKTQISPDELGLLHPPANPRLARIALLDRDRTGSLPGALVEKLTLREALEVLVPQTSSLSFLDRGLVRLCEALDSSGGAVRLRYAQAEHLLPVVLSLLDGATQPTANPRRGWSPLSRDRTADPAPSIGMVRRIRPEDIVELLPSPGKVPSAAAELAILHGERLTVLGGLGSTLWSALADWHSRQDLVDVAVAAHGPHPDAAGVVDRTLTDLSERGLVEVSKPEVR